MSREIKFRAWHGGHKSAEPQMCYDDKLGDCLVWKNQGQNIITIMQYTGLKDKNGKDIYEGDLVQYSEMPDHILPIIYEKACYYVKAPDGYEDEFLGEVHDEYEIIGNIYENKELINHEQESLEQDN